MKTYRILGKRGRITVPYEIRCKVGFKQNDILSFEEAEDGKAVIVKRERLCDCDDGRKLPILTFGPMGIATEYKRQGYGKRLLDYSIEKAEETGAGALVITGNILFYGKSGFVPATPK